MEIERSKKSMMSHEFNKASVVALYGLQDSLHLGNCYDHALNWFNLLGSPPDKLGFSKGAVNEDVRSFKQSDMMLRQEGFEKIRGFSLYSLIPGGTYPGYDWKVTAEVSLDDSYCIIGARSSIAPLPGESMLSISRAMIQDLSPTYGIGYTRDMKLGPSLYGAGMCQGLQPWGAERAEVERIDKWQKFGIEQRIYNTGILRDIYKWNFLNDIHLAQMIRGISLKELIARNNSTGRIFKTNDNLYLWDLTNNEIMYVKSLLYGTGLILG